MPEKPKKKRKLDLQAVNEVAALCALRLTETEAIGKLGITKGQWFTWKSRRKGAAQFEEALQRLRGEKLAAHLANVEAAAKGTGPHAKSDWRASAWILEKAATTDGRYSDQVTVEGKVTVGHIFAGSDYRAIGAKVYGEAKQIAAPPTQKPQLGPPPASDDA